MNESKRKQLFAAVRGCAPVEVPSNFASRVTNAMTRSDGRRETPSVFDQLSSWFPRLAAAALLVIGVALIFEFFVGTNLASELTQASDQWLLPMSWL